jgi:hypothetical protein
MATVCALVTMRVAFAIAVHSIRRIRGMKALRLGRLERQKQQYVTFGRIVTRSVPRWFGFTPASDGGAPVARAWASLDGACCAAWEGYAIRKGHRAGSRPAVRRTSRHCDVRASPRGPLLCVAPDRACGLRERTNNDLGSREFHSAVRQRSTITRRHWNSADVGPGRGAV